MSLPPTTIRVMCLGVADVSLSSSADTELAWCHIGSLALLLATNARCLISEPLRYGVKLASVQIREKAVH